MKLIVMIVFNYYKEFHLNLKFSAYVKTT